MDASGAGRVIFRVAEGIFRKKSDGLREGGKPITIDELYEYAFIEIGIGSEFWNLTLYEWTLTIARATHLAKERASELEFFGHLVASHMALTANINRGKGKKAFSASDFFDPKKKTPTESSKQPVIERFKNKPLKSKLNGR